MKQTLILAAWVMLFSCVPLLGCLPWCGKKKKAISQIPDVSLVSKLHDGSQESARETRFYSGIQYAYIKTISALDVDQHVQQWHRDMYIIFNGTLLWKMQQHLFSFPDDPEIQVAQKDLIMKNTKRNDLVPTYKILHERVRIIVDRLSESDCEEDLNKAGQLAFFLQTYNELVLSGFVSRKPAFVSSSVDMKVPRKVTQGSQSFGEDT